jgi:hypothetical protein
MNINAAFPSKYIKAAEVPEEGVTLKVANVDVEDVDGKGSRKPVVYFRKAKKGLVLNVTNSKKIAQLLGTAETDEWVDRSVTLYRSETEYAGETVDCIRVRAAKNGQSSKPEPLPEPVSELTDDQIPF